MPLRTTYTLPATIRTSIIIVLSFKLKLSKVRKRNGDVRCSTRRRWHASAYLTAVSTSYLVMFKGSFTYGRLLKVRCLPHQLLPKALIATYWPRMSFIWVVVPSQICKLFKGHCHYSDSQQTWMNMWFHLSMPWRSTLVLRPSNLNLSFYLITMGKHSQSPVSMKC